MTAKSQTTLGAIALALVTRDTSRNLPNGTTLTREVDVDKTP